MPVVPIRGRVRGRILVLLCIMYGIAYIDRTNISTAAPYIQSALNLSDLQLGLAFSAFSVPYALLQIVGGTIGEKLGPRKALTWITILWGIATIATGFATGLASLIGARLLLGLSESAAFPTGTLAMSRWFPLSRNGFIQGVVHSAARLGNAIAPLIVAALIAWSGWRSSFFYIGAFSVLWALLWVYLFRNEPKSHPSISERELAELPEATTPKVRLPIPWKRLLHAMVPVAFVDFGYGWTLWVFLTWLPSFLSKTYHLPLSQFALYTALILGAGVIGDTVGGMLSDRLLIRSGNVLWSRRTGILIGLIGSLICLTPLLFTQGLAVAATSLALSFFFLELANAPLWSIPMDVAPKWAGTASGIMNTGFGVAGIMSPILFGALLPITGWRVPFGISIGLLVIAAIIAAFMKPQPVDTASYPKVTEGVA